MEACIIKVADVVEAMSSHRPYRLGKGIEAALREIRKMRGRRYDSKVVDACLALFRNGFTLPDIQKDCSGAFYFKSPLSAGWVANEAVNKREIQAWSIYGLV